MITDQINDIPLVNAMITDQINNINDKLKNIDKGFKNIHDELKSINRKLLSMEEKLNLIIAQRDINEIEKYQLINRICLLEEKCA